MFGVRTVAVQIYSTLAKDVPLTGSAKESLEATHGNKK